MTGEAEIIVNRVRLTGAQAMLVRVACTAFADLLAEDPEMLGSDDHGRGMHALYRERAREVLRLLVGRPAMTGEQIMELAGIEDRIRSEGLARIDEVLRPAREHIDKPVTP